jgi:UTP--glucose-1-phosphate uridylyltransferase
MASRAIPSHLKPSSAAGKDDGGFNSQRHHGKTQSHVVSYFPAPAS